MGFMYSGVAIIDMISLASQLHNINIQREKLTNTLSEVPRILDISSVFQDLNFSLKLGSTELR